MFNLLKRKSEQQIVAEIHNEFDTAEDRLLSQADRLLKELDLKTEQSVKDKAERLHNLGFVNAEPVRWIKNNSSVKTMQDAELIRYYKQNYPFQKFLTEIELNRICKKYNLVHAPIPNYIKDVPEKNLKEIEGIMMLKPEDLPQDKIWCKLKKDASFWLFGGGDSWASIFGKEWYLIPAKIEGLHFSSKYQASDYLRNNIQGLTKEYLVSRIENFTESKQGLFICAPASHFDLTGLNESGEFSFKSWIVQEPKDPIVFRYVRGGAQVLSKWGLEASDEALLNDINN